MKQEINPKDTNRAMAFELWMKSPMPMVSLTKTFDVTRLCRVSHRRGIKFNMLLVHRQDCQPDRRVLFAAGARETDEV